MGEVVLGGENVYLSPSPIPTLPLTILSVPPTNPQSASHYYQFPVYLSLLTTPVYHSLSPICRSPSPLPTEVLANPAQWQIPPEGIEEDMAVAVLGGESIYRPPSPVYQSSPQRV